jgi:hypothetical protein
MICGASEHTEQSGVKCASERSNSYDREKREDIEGKDLLYESVVTDSP